MKIQVALRLFSLEDLEDMIHVITASVKNQSVVTRTWLNTFHVPDILIGVSKRGITVCDIATIMQANAASIPPLDRSAWLIEKAYQAGVGSVISFPIHKNGRGLENRIQDMKL